jgi:hypothetical protein
VCILNAFLVRLALQIIEFASVLTLLFLVMGWALRHVGDAILSLALDIADLHTKFRSVKKQSAETKLVVTERGLSAR